MINPRHIQASVTLEELPSDIYLLFDAFRSNTETRSHSHSWGQLQIISGGILELKAEGQRFLAPSHFAIWVPAGVQHQSYNRKPIAYCSVNIIPELANKLPNHTCLLEVSPLVETLIAELRDHNIQQPKNEQQDRLIKVLFDQLLVAKQSERFLPVSKDKLLTPILEALESNPADETSLSQWAARNHTTERTLARHCQNELGMSFTEWRLRIRYLYSLELLRKNMSIKEIAFSLGYNQTSPFITMFKRYADCTPEQYKLKYSI
ncbi:helix-turn-helix transcriptional regulator [uncultured Aliivibrio sp.]|uniref:AraC family transcriptional regulator n=1 Tax=uncultured Aliivibrio sp. TaxID=873085 RepID=UPI00262D25DC|nr:helix-turn-helix transcriptional regulator [uncultured Aliivibrio sp.]